MSSEETSTYFSQANAAFVAEEYEKAAELYTKAIEKDDSNPDFYINRAHTLQKLERYKDAKDDADRALVLDGENPRAQLRKGIASFHLGLYEEAFHCFTSVEMIEGNSFGVQQWLTWTCDKLSKMKPAEIASPIQPEINSTSSSAQQKIRHDWYQTESHVCVTVLAKNLDPKDVNIQFEEQKMVMTAKLPDGMDYKLDLHLLYPIVRNQCSFSVLKTKVEIKMKKQDGIRWNSLEGEAQIHLKQIPVSNSGLIPVYPSSAPKKRDWDKIEVEIKKEEADEKLEGEAALNQLFQKIYAEGSDEVRRAMNKSFQESGGTVLSTNWKEVAKEKIEVKPPDGLEFRKWTE